MHHVTFPDSGSYSLHFPRQICKAQGCMQTKCSQMVRQLNLKKTFEFAVCADCVKAEPVIYKLVNEVEKPVTLVRVYVGDRPTWRSPDHPLRRDDRFNVKGVPTLIRWEDGAVVGRLEVHEADDQVKIKKLLA